MRPEPESLGCSPRAAGMSTARVDYIAPWWTYWLHNFPHINLRFQPVDNSFQPEEENYQQVSGWRWDGQGPS